MGSGTLITFPVLLALGYPAVTANVSNAVGLVPGLFAGALGYRTEIATQPRRTLTWFGAASFVGGACGALLLLVLPAAAFRAIVPFFIALAVLLIILQPALQRASRHRQPNLETIQTNAYVIAALAVCGMYGGYFGAAQGILLLATLGFVLPNHLQVANGLKNLLNLITNLVAAIAFVAVANVAWGAALLIAGGSIGGGVAGARLGRRLHPPLLRILVVVVGVVAFIRLLWA